MRLVCWWSDYLHDYHHFLASFFIFPLGTDSENNAIVMLNHFSLSSLSIYLGKLGDAYCHTLKGKKILPWKILLIPIIMLSLSYIFSFNPSHPGAVSYDSWVILGGKHDIYRLTLVSVQWCQINPLSRGTLLACSFLT